MSASCQNLDEAKLNRRLTEKLPAYMCPDQIFIVEKLPKSARGKIDRRKLQAMYLDTLNQSGADDGATAAAADNRSEHGRKRRVVA